ncbi:DNA-binding transcriptional LysR family regulator [Roseibium marinum]|uniref:DNA-binding transcriptional LysR family regulator n=2 Tax=Roseibium marinum TaxID=281252 RepID=A0A2S3UUS0_9HYPH|nr:DNA-binding transcriptional LysR family regulator [Roseibium marinum]
MIVRTGSLASAADRLGMSPSAASRMIGVLEHELKLTLFSRRNRNLDLTGEGREFLRRSQHILEGLERLTDIAAQVRSVDSDPLRLVSTVPLAISVFSPVLAIWQAENPGVRSVLNIETRFDLESKVAAREYNLGILSLPVENAIVDLDVEPLVSARYEVAMARGHRLANRETLTIQDIVDEDFVALRPAQRWRKRLDAMAMSHSFAPRIVSETSSSAAALDLVRNGLGVTLADRIHAGLQEDERLVLRPLEPDMWTDYCLVTGKGRTSVATRDFSNRIRAWLTERCYSSPALARVLRFAPEAVSSRPARSLPATAN